jgi:hypothetical protein
MQLAHALGSFDINRVLRFNNLRLVARNKAERFNVLIQVFKLKSSDGLRTEIMQTEALKITNENLT